MNIPDPRSMTRDHWFVFVQAGPHERRRLITDIDNNATGVPFRIVQ